MQRPIRKRAWIFSLLALLCAPAAYLLSRFAFSHPIWTEQFYVQKIYLPLSQALSAIFGLLPFSAAEAIVVSALIWIPALLFLAYRRARKNGGARLRSVSAAVLRALEAASLLYLFYMLLCGMQYARQPLSLLLGYQADGMTVSELELLCQNLVQEACALREDLTQDANGVFTLEDGLDAVLTRTQQNYTSAAQTAPILAGAYSTPKKVTLSPLWAYTQTTGMFFPYTVEANINTINSPMLFAATAAHEAAHQRGFMREDEANFLAWYVCRQSDHAQDRYSGAMLALIHAGNALYRADPQAYARVSAQYSDAMARDLVAHNALWDAYEGKTAEISQQVNNTYLRANNQTDGVASYGRMVDLLAAYYRSCGLFDTSAN